MRRKKYDELNGLLPQEEAADDSRHTLAELLERDQEWLRNRLRSKGTIYLTGLAVAHLCEALGTNAEDLHLDEIGPAAVERFITRRRAAVKAHAINRELGNLRATFNRGMKVFGMIDRNPFAGVERLPIEKKAIRPLPVSDEKKLLAACATDFELNLFVRIALDTGCRAGEICYLRWDALELDTGMATIESSADWKTKTRNSRCVAFSPHTVGLLRQWQARRVGAALVFGEEETGAREYYYEIRKRFGDAVKRAKIGHVTLHDLRRTVGSRLAARGVNQKVIAALLGHADITTTAKYYQAVEPETIRQAVVEMRRAQEA